MNRPSDPFTEDPRLSHFSWVLPLPFRVTCLVACGLLGWALNLQGLQQLGVDVEGILDVSAPTNAKYYPISSTLPHHSLHQSVYTLFFGFTLWSGLCWAGFRLLTYSDITLLDNYHAIPVICILAILCAVVAPGNVLCKRERYLFLRSIRRCFMSQTKTNLSDVLLADILTSYAKVLGDIWLSIGMLLPGGSLIRVPIRGSSVEWAVPCIIGLPYCIRFRQCLSDFANSDYRDSQSFFNAIKYLSAFPVIFLSAFQKLASSAGSPNEEDDVVWHGEHPLFRLWLLSVVINSLYSFWWDVTHDWGFNLFTARNLSSSSDPSRHVNSENQDSGVPNVVLASRHTHRDDNESAGLRRALILFPSPAPYYFAVLINLILRLTWSLKLSPHLHDVAELEYGVFVIEGLELFRRWVWVFLRIEWEAIKIANTEAKSSGSYELVEET